MRSSIRTLSVAALTLAVVNAAPAQETQRSRPSYPEGAPIPRSLTPEEIEWLRENPLRPNLRGVTPAPTGPVHCVAEYEPMEAILIAWEGGSTLNQIQANMAGYITNVGNADLYVVLDTASEQTTAQATLAAAGANMARVKWFVRTTDSIWIRDYGPRYVYEGNCRAVVDHTYNRPRPLDDAMNQFFAAFRGHAFYEHQLIHGGGNYHLNALTKSYCTRLINNENPGLTEQQIHDIWQNYQNVDTTFFTPFPTTIDSTQHIDMWMEVCADDRVVISDWPNNAGSTQDQICDSAAASMASAGYTVFRTPARSVNGVHYTYTNVVMCNNIVLVPTYTNSTVQPHNNPALSVWQTALPAKTIVGINCQNIISLAGAIHCIVMHVPAHRGGVNPTVYLKNLRGGEVLNPADQVEIRWISDDDVDAATVDILLSEDSGVTFPTVLAAATPDDGAFVWTVPEMYAPHARLKLVVHDADGHTGSDAGDSDFRINGVSDEPGDMNCDGSVNPFDITPFVTALTSPSQYRTEYPDCDIQNGDMNDDGSTNTFDIQGFVERLSQP